MGEPGDEGMIGPPGPTGPQGPAGGGGGGSATTVEVDLGAASWEGHFTITDATIGAASKVLAWQAPGPYTGKGTLADEAAMQPVSVIAVEPAVGSAVLYWETPPVIAPILVTPSGALDLTPTGQTFEKGQYVRGTRRLGKVAGSVKFSYMVLT